MFALALIACLAASSVDSQEQEAVGHYLFAWAGDVEQKGNDFLAVIDADPSSPSYGHLVTTLATDQQTKLVHHTEYSFQLRELRSRKRQRQLVSRESRD
jgi:hypothetical protein